MNGQESKNRCQQCGEPKRGHVCMARLKNRGESGADAEEALSAWAEHSRGYLSSPNVSRQSSFNGIPSISRQSSYHSAGAVPRVAMDDDDDDPEVSSGPGAS